MKTIENFKIISITKKDAIIWKKDSIVISFKNKENQRVFEIVDYISNQELNLIYSSYEIKTLKKHSGYKVLTNKKEQRPHLYHLTNEELASFLKALKKTKATKEMLAKINL